MLRRWTARSHCPLQSGSGALADGNALLFRQRGYDANDRIFERTTGIKPTVPENYASKLSSHLAG